MKTPNIQEDFPRIRKSPKGVMTQIKIIDAYLELMKDTDFDKIMASAVAEKAGITRSTFYAYFTDIYDIIEYVEGELAAHLPEPSGDGVGKPAFSKGCPPDPKRCEIPEWFFEWFEYARIFSRQLNVLLGPHGNPQFEHKMRKAIKQANLKQMRLDGNEEFDEEDLLLKGISDCQLSITREFIRNCQDFGEDSPILKQQVGSMAYFLNTVRVGTWYLHYLDLEK